MAGLPPIKGLSPQHNLAYFHQQGPAAAAAAAGTLTPTPTRQVASAGGAQQFAPIRDEALVQNDIAPPAREEEFEGVATDVADQMLDPRYFTFCENWQGVEAFGSCGTRRGVTKHDKSRLTINPGGGTPNYASHYGHDILALEPFDASESAASGNVLLVTLGTEQTYGAADAGLVAWIVRSAPLWSDARDLDGVSVLQITLDVSTAGRLRVTAETTGGLSRNDVTAIIIRYSTTDYPVSPDGREDGTESVAVSNADRGAFFGASTNFDTTGLAPGVYYVTAWPCSREGLGEPVRAKATVT